MTDVTAFVKDAGEFHGSEIIFVSYDNGVLVLGKRNDDISFGIRWTLEAAKGVIHGQGNPDTQSSSTQGQLVHLGLDGESSMGLWHLEENTQAKCANGLTRLPDEYRSKTENLMALLDRVAAGEGPIDGRMAALVSGPE